MPKCAPHRVASLAVLLVAYVASGCSFALTRPVSVADRPDDPPMCTSSMLPPVLDTTGAAVTIGGLAAAHTLGGIGCIDYEGEGTCGEVDGGATGAAVLIATVYTVSAVYGYAKSAECSGVKSRAQARPIHPPDGRAQ